LRFAAINAFGVFLGSMARSRFSTATGFLRWYWGLLETGDQSHCAAHVLVLVTAGFAFHCGGLLLMRRMRRSISEEGSFSDTTFFGFGVREFSANMYHAVIQQLKQQKTELQSLHWWSDGGPDSENISAAVLSIFPRACSSSLLTDWSGRPSVRETDLGFASPAGMNAAGQVFREAELISASDGAYASLRSGE